jgi:NAD(P)-dependent dehydrogenase (short-subunit alcohol dehydrogenase family)
MGHGILAGKVVLVTGAGRGLGHAFAGACLDEGATVVIGELDRTLGEAAARDLASRGPVEFVQFDLGEPASIAALAETVGKHHGRIDGLVNNAAIATGIGGKSFEEIDVETFDRVMRVNIRGTWLMIKAAAPWLRKSGKGKIVNLASDTAMWGAPVLLHYVASKGAIIAMTRSLARELGPDGIAVNTIAPGLVRVEATEYVPQARHDLYEQQRAMPRAQFPEDVTGAVVFLLSDAASFVTGQLLPVNGGFVFN